MMHSFRLIEELRHIFYPLHQLVSELVMFLNRLSVRVMLCQIRLNTMHITKRFKSMSAAEAHFACPHIFPNLVFSSHFEALISVFRSSFYFFLVLCLGVCLDLLSFGSIKCAMYRWRICLYSLA